MAIQFVYNPFSGTFDAITAGAVTALAPVGSSPNANAATLSSGTLNLEPANASFPGVVTIGTQTFAGAKTLTSALTITPTTNQLVLGTTNTTTISATAPSTSRTITIPDPGTTGANFVLTEAAQTINGSKDLTASTAVASAAASAATIGNASSTAVHILNGGLKITQRSTSSNLTIDTTTTDHAVLVDTTGGAVTITLPAHSAGRIVRIKDKGGAAETNNITIARNGGTGNIEGVAASKILSTNYGAWTFISDGSAWFMV